MISSVLSVKQHHHAKLITMAQSSAQPTKSSEMQLCKTAFFVFLFFTDHNRAMDVNTIQINLTVQGEHKRTLGFQNDSENKCGVLITSHPTSR
jgi:hypothetical protein